MRTKEVVEHEIALTDKDMTICNQATQIAILTHNAASADLEKHKARRAALALELASLTTMGVTDVNAQS